eukprot:TRINITY_DN1336_c0_g1_i11.p1 TRINITY_DN1336_c0_g1~~TRINITY_DN1336_c0_g1_i11.p1  ORF type:complete len:219 (-),score=45.82 TRINITY_DN1336_c0_g1_i11:74-730(-)
MRCLQLIYKECEIYAYMLLAVLPLVTFVCLSRCEKLINPRFAKELQRIATWEVADPRENVFKDMKKEQFKRMLMTSIPQEQSKLRNSTRDTPVEDRAARGYDSVLPRQFSWLREMPECIHSGRDQGSDCGSCWAFAIANHLSDRFCIWGRDVILSVQNLLECDKRNMCCSGGNDANAYEFLTETGIVEERCRPYPCTLSCYHCFPCTCLLYTSPSPRD